MFGCVCAGAGGGKGERGAERSAAQSPPTIQRQQRLRDGLWRVKPVAVHAGSGQAREVKGHHGQLRSTFKERSYSAAFESYKPLAPGPYP